MQLALDLWQQLRTKFQLLSKVAGKSHTQFYDFLGTLVKQIAVSCWTNHTVIKQAPIGFIGSWLGKSQVVIPWH